MKRHLPENDRTRLGNPSNLRLDEYHGKRDIYGSRVGGGKEGEEKARRAAAAAAAGVAVADEPEKEAPLTQLNAQADALEERTERKIDRTPEALAQAAEFQADNKVYTDLAAVARDQEAEAGSRAGAIERLLAMEAAERAKAEPRPHFTKRFDALRRDKVIP